MGGSASLNLTPRRLPNGHVIVLDGADPDSLGAAGPHADAVRGSRPPAPETGDAWLFPLREAF